MKVKALTEKQIQRMLWEYLHKRYLVIIPNFYGAFGWEVDMCAITRSGYIHEYEIKRSVRDLEADKNKWRKMLRIKTAYSSPSEASKMPPDGSFRVPKRFYYVCSFWPSVSDVPSFAGVWHVSRGNEPKELRPAEDLPAARINETQVQKALVSMCYRFWRMKEKHESKTSSKKKSVVALNGNQG